MSPHRERALLVATVAAPAALYVATVTTRALGGDDGELATIAVTGGVAHPPGYPLIALYLHAMRWLPGTPAHAAGLANALLAIAAVAVLARACRAWGASIAASAIATLAWALAPTTWGLAVQAEVFALNALFAALILWLASPEAPLAPARRAIALALVAGLALANHATIGALAPLGLYAFVAAVRASTARARVIGGSAAALAIGLAPYAFVAIASPRGLDPSTWSWGGVHDAASFAAYLARSEYPASQLTSPDNVVAGVARVVAQLLGLPVIALGAIALWRARRREPVAWRAIDPRWLALLASCGLAGPAFATIFHVPTEGIGAAVTERFDLLPMAILVPACARAIDLGAPTLASRPVVASIAASAVLALGVARGLPAVRARERPTVALYVENALLAAPPDSVILGTGDHRFGAFTYARYALGERPDVLYVNPRLLPAPWYRARIERALGVALPVHDRVVDVAALLGVLLRTGRPIFVTDLFTPKPLRAVPSYPIGPLIRLVPRPDEVPSPPALEAMNLDLAARMQREPWPPPGPDPWSDALLEDYARPWEALAAAFAAMGDEARAKANEARAAEAREGR